MEMLRCYQMPLCAKAYRTFVTQFTQVVSKQQEIKTYFSNIKNFSLKPWQNIVKEFQFNILDVYINISVITYLTTANSYLRKVKYNVGCHETYSLQELKNSICIRF